MQTAQYNIEGMHCAGCAAAIEKKISALPGIRQAQVSLVARSLTVEFSDEREDAPVLSAVQSLGFAIQPLAPCAPVPVPVPHAADASRRLLASFLIWLVIFATMVRNMLHPFSHVAMYGSFQLGATLLLFVLNRRLFLNGAKRLFRAPDMDSLVALGASASFLLSLASLAATLTGHAGTFHFYFESAAMVVTIVSFGKFLEERAKRKAGAALDKLRALAPSTVVILKNKVETEIPLAVVACGDRVVIRPGARIPVDGMILSGHSAIDESSLTGESTPRDVGPGDTLHAGTVNLTGAVHLRADKVGQDTTLAEIIRLVGQSALSKSQAVRLADALAARFVPIVAALALLAVLIWLLCGMPVFQALSIGITVLVVSCPCALGLATPVSVTVAMSRAAASGILFKNAAALEMLPKITTVFLDKTGTLTTGKPAVSAVTPLANDYSAESLLALAAALETDSEHPVGAAIVKAARGRNLSLPDTDAFDSITGRGVTAFVDGKAFVAGNADLMADVGIAVPDTLISPQMSAQGRTRVYLGCQEEPRLLGCIDVQDHLADDAAEAVKTLKASGLRPVMLTGDSQAAAASIASELAIDYQCRLMPAAKAEIIRKASQAGQITAMVGDGINDAPALSTAHVAIAIGAGADIAIDCADIVMMRNSLLDVPRALHIARQAAANIRQNLFWAFFYNILLIPIAAGCLYKPFGLLMNPMIAALAMSFSSLCVVTNALRLLKKE